MFELSKLNTDTGMVAIWSNVVSCSRSCYLVISYSRYLASEITRTRGKITRIHGEITRTRECEITRTRECEITRVRDNDSAR